MNISRMYASYLLAIDRLTGNGDADLLPTIRGVEYTQGDLGGNAHTARTGEFKFIGHNH